MRVIGIAGWSGSGKTTLLTKLIPELKQRGLRVSTLKHAHHAFDVDQPGKDSYVHREAGATEVLIVSKNRFALMHELRDQPEPHLHELFAKLAPVDLILVEGFKSEAHRKIEVFRAANAKPPLYPDDAQIVAIASDVVLADAGRPVIDLNDVSAIADCTIAHAEPLRQLMARLAVTHRSASVGESLGTDVP